MLRAAVLVLVLFEAPVRDLAEAHLAAVHAAVACPRKQRKLNIGILLLNDTQSSEHSIALLRKLFGIKVSRELWTAQRGSACHVFPFPQS